MRILQRIKTVGYNSLFLFGILSILTVVAWFTEKYIQLATLIIVWTILFYNVDKMLHFWYDGLCFVVTTATTTACLLVSFPIGYSLFSIVPIVALTFYVLRTIRDRNDLDFENQKLKAPKSFRVYGCTEVALRARCKERFPFHRHYGKDVVEFTERAVRHFIHRESHTSMDTGRDGMGEQSKTERKTMRRYLEQEIAGEY